jgi:hypothetical protein
VSEQWFQTYHSLKSWKWIQELLGIYFRARRTETAQNADGRRGDRGTLNGAG